MKGKRPTTQQKIRTLREGGGGKSISHEPKPKITFHLAQFSAPAQYSGDH